MQETALPNLFFFSLFLCSARSWSGEPHEIIMQIATNMLNSKQKEWITKLLSYWPSEPQELPLVANWQDMIISDTSRVFSQWHFSDTPYIEENFTANPKYTFNVSTAIEDELNSIMNPTTTSIWSLIFNFRNLFHFVGDAHCPVHSITYYGVDYENGDAGGNGRYTNCKSFISGPQPYFCKNLHKIWDSVILNYDHNKYTAPDMPEYWQNITELTKTFPLDSFQDSLAERDPHKWVQESFESAVHYAYGMLVNDSAITQEYFDVCSVEAKRRVTLAGYRLGLVMQNFFKVRGMPEFPADASYTREIIVWILDAIVVSFIIFYSIWIVCDNASNRKYAYLARVPDTV